LWWFAKLIFFGNGSLDPYEPHGGSTCIELMWWWDQLKGARLTVSGICMDLGTPGFGNYGTKMARASVAASQITLVIVNCGFVLYDIVFF